MDKKKLGARIKEFRTSNNLTQQDIADYLNLKNKSTVGSWEIGKSEPDIDTFAKLCILFNISPNEFIDYKEQAAITLSEKQLLMKYQRLDFFGKKAVDDLLETEYTRVLELKPNIIKLPLADFSLSAGTGNLLLDNTYEFVEVDGNKYPQADIAFRVSGDSMTPKYSDGDIVFIHRQPTVEVGEIGAFLYNGNQFLKQLTHSNSTYKLHSLNSAYSDIEIKDDVIVYGKVLN